MTVVGGRIRNSIVGVRIRNSIVEREVKNEKGPLKRGMPCPSNWQRCIDENSVVPLPQSSLRRRLRRPVCLRCAKPKLQEQSRRNFAVYALFVDVVHKANTPSSIISTSSPKHFRRSPLVERESTYTLYSTSQRAREIKKSTQREPLPLP